MRDPDSTYSYIRPVFRILAAILGCASGFLLFQSWYGGKAVGLPEAFVAGLMFTGCFQVAVYGRVPTRGATTPEYQRARNEAHGKRTGVDPLDVTDHVPGFNLRSLVFYGGIVLLGGLLVLVIEFLR